MESIKGFIKKNTVFCIALSLAVITSFIVPPDEKYIEYFDFKTLACLFSVLAVVCALRNIDFFNHLARSIVTKFKGLRTTVVALIYITFIASMFIANDMALLTFLPLGFFILESTGKQKYMAFVFIMQTIAANLGGMLTPFGNPQNLYMYSYYNIPTGEFVDIMLKPFLFAVTIITLCCLLVKNEPLEVAEEIKEPLNKKRTAVYLVLFALAIIIVFRIIPYYIGMAVIFIALLFLDRKALKMVDYPLLLTFCAFFVFSGNMSRIDAVREFLGGLIDKNTLLVGVLSCQVISNVPSAILLSKFTLNYPTLLVAVNIGSLGTLISSLASLITFREFIKHNPTRAGRYIALYSVFNFGILILMMLFAYFVM